MVIFKGFLKSFRLYLAEILNAHISHCLNFEVGEEDLGENFKWIRCSLHTLPHPLGAAIVLLCVIGSRPLLVKPQCVYRIAKNDDDDGDDVIRYRF